MKKQFWFIGFFGVWCLLSALWYFLSVKGVITDPGSFKPQIALMAIVEILVMLLVSCILGYEIAWWMRGQALEKKKEKLEMLRNENRSLIAAAGELKKQVELWRDKHLQDLRAVGQKVSDLTSEREKLQKQKNETESYLIEIKHERNEARTNLKQAENELGTLKYRIRQLEFQIKEIEESNVKFKNEIAEITSRKEKTSVSDHPFVRAIDQEDKDDLTKIKGIGPFIEKRLNMIGIYTFHQLAELSPETIDRVGTAIEFFPHRIVRDNWVGQARNFC